MKTAYVWVSRPRDTTRYEFVFYAGITQRELRQRFTGGYRFDRGSIRVRKSEIEVVGTHEVESYEFPYDQELANNFQEQHYINTVRAAGATLEGLGISVRVGNKSDAVPLYNCWRRNSEACEAGWFQSIRRVKEYEWKKEVGFYTRGQYKHQRGRRKLHWKDTDCRKFLQWCEMFHEGSSLDMGVYDSIIEKVRKSS
jgi:hypothetical protein